MNKSVPQLPADYVSLLAETKELVCISQVAAFNVVNKDPACLDWDIDWLIAELQVDTTHGKAVVQRLNRDLQTEFPGLYGFSRRNVFYMREFYLPYRDSPQVRPLVAQVDWTQDIAGLLDSVE